MVNQTIILPKAAIRALISSLVRVVSWISSRIWAKIRLQSRWNRLVSWLTSVISFLYNILNGKNYNYLLEIIFVSVQFDWNCTDLFFEHEFGQLAVLCILTITTYVDLILPRLESHRQKKLNSMITSSRCRRYLVWILIVDPKDLNSRYFTLHFLKRYN